VVCNYIVCTILGYENTRLAIVAYAIAHGIAGMGERSVGQWASQLGVSKQALSKEVTWFRDTGECSIAFGALKTDAARTKYQTAQNERYARMRNL
jgi:hypothetical protein